jgi:hypothetical protein
VRTILPPGQVVHRCDVASITGKAWAGANEVGRVTAVYVKAYIGGHWFYGWLMHSWAWKTSASPTACDDADGDGYCPRVLVVNPIA